MKLTTKQRSGLRDSQFAVPSRRAFPITDPSHARAALRFINYAHSAYEKANIRRRANAMLNKGK